MENILAVDLGGTHTTVAVFSHDGADRFSRLHVETWSSPAIADFPGLLRDFLLKNAGLQPAVTRACIDFAGPIEPARERARATNLNWGFTASEVCARTGLSQVILLNDFEAIGYGLEVLAANKPDVFVRLSAAGALPPRSGKKPTAVIIGAGTGLGTSILVQDSRSGRYRPVPGEGGHADFVALEEMEFRIAGWIREHRNHSPLFPSDWEKVVSGPGIANIYEALSKIGPEAGSRALFDRIATIDPADRPPVIAGAVDRDPVCRATLDLWMRCYARVAKNCALFPLAPGGVFLAGGVAAKILAELQAGPFMEEFVRCDIPSIRGILQRTPVFVITDYEIGLYGCASVAVNPSQLD